MAKVVLIDTPVANTKTIKSVDYPITKLANVDVNVRLDDITFNSQRLKAVDYPVTRFTDIQPTVKVSTILPFRVKFTNIGIESWGPNNVPPIGIAVIGINNYIL